MLGAFLAFFLATSISFSSPVNYEITLAGNFGEPRPNHFHGGLDIKTGGVEGKPIFSIGDGYVAKVSIGLYGFGNAVYVQHPEGYTSVYCHLQKFTPQITAMVRKWQYQHKRSKGEMVFQPTDLPVSKGQLIAVSGNTGASQAPHLHLEIHDSKTWDMKDPLGFIGDQMSDGVAPIAHAFMAYPVKGEGVFCGRTDKQSFAFSSPHLQQPFTAWGQVGFGIWANDYMEATYNRYGVRYVDLQVDGERVFHCDVDNIPVKDNMMINAWGDYEHFQRYRIWYLRSYVPHGVTLPLFETNANRGIVNINEERIYHFKYTLTDYKGNSSVYTFQVRGQRCSIPASPSVAPQHTLYWERANDYQLPGLQLSVPQGYMGENIHLSPRQKQQSGGFSDAFQLMPVSTPLFYYAPLRLQVLRDVPNPDKLYIVGHAGTDLYMGGHYHDGWVEGKVRDLGYTYELAYDDVPPSVHLTQQPSASHPFIAFSVADKGSGLSFYEGYLDGQFILFEEVAKSNVVRCNLRESPVRPTGKAHTLRFIATDNRNNQQVITSKIVY